MSRSLIGLGSNVGDRRVAIVAAIESLGEHPDVEIGACSRLFDTLAVGGPSDQGAFLNAAVVIETRLSPKGLLEWLRNVEDSMGRRRDQRWGPRVIDLDLLLYHDVVIPQGRRQWLAALCTCQNGSLIVPHPRMAFRRFVLAPAADVAPNMKHPVLGWSVKKMRDHLDQSTDYVAICGIDRDACCELARRLVQQCGVVTVENHAALCRVNWDSLDSTAVSSFWRGEEGSRQQETPLPKLLVHLHVFGDPASDQTSWEIEQSYDGPVLLLDASRGQHAAIEAAAAIEAMQ